MTGRVHRAHRARAAIPCQRTFPDEEPRHERAATLPPDHAGASRPDRLRGERGGTGLDDPRALQILSTEHWSLLATRSLSWNESFSRAGLFLSVVSATAVALALVGQATDFGDQFLAFALVMLPIALFVGLATFTRLDEVNGEDTSGWSA